PSWRRPASCCCLPGLGLAARHDAPSMLWVVELSCPLTRKTPLTHVVQQCAQGNQQRQRGQEKRAPVVRPHGGSDAKNVGGQFPVPARLAVHLRFTPSQPLQEFRFGASPWYFRDSAADRANGVRV